MIVEIHGTNSHNCGAEMMAIEIARRLRGRYAEAVRIAVPPDFGSASDRKRHGFLLAPEFISTAQRKLLSACDRWAPKPFVACARSADFTFQRAFCGMRHLGAHDVAPPLSVDVIIDASGFAFSDQWGRHKAQDLYEKITYRRRHVPLIMLPQAMGPFRLPHVAPMCDLLLRRANVVFVRDLASLEMVTELTRGEVNVRCFPDFTIPLQPAVGDDLLMSEKYGAVVPNFRMIDKGNHGTAYMDFLVHALKLVTAAGVQPVLLLHEGKEDSCIVDLLRERGLTPKVLQHADPLVLKRYLGGAEFVIGSRFHALVSALSQGVPSIAAGWSHKYHELFKDFGVADFVVDDIGDLGSLEAHISRISNAETRATLASRISVASMAMKNHAEEMWNEVFAVIDQRAGVSTPNRR
jgi:colanic acid/amylovoran biosynthesis protein